MKENSITKLKKTKKIRGQRKSVENSEKKQRNEESELQKMFKRIKDRKLHREIQDRKLQDEERKLVPENVLQLRKLQVDESEKIIENQVAITPTRRTYVNVKERVKKYVEKINSEKKIYPQERTQKIIVLVQ